jgi:hypothetical protein
MSWTRRSGAARLAVVAGAVGAIAVASIAFAAPGRHGKGHEDADRRRATSSSSSETAWGLRTAT